MELPERKGLRLKYFNYNTAKMYFLTICTKDKKEILSKIIGGKTPVDKAQVVLLPYGKIADKVINQMNDFYDNIDVKKYVIMPNHIHLLIHVTRSIGSQSDFEPFKRIDNTNSTVSKFISTFKRFCNKEYGKNIWQARFYDHVIKGSADYCEVWDYIKNNPRRWMEKGKKQ